MKILIAHNDYGRPSGEEAACEALAALLRDHGHEVAWMRRSSTGIRGPSGKAAAFFSGIANPRARREMARRLDAFQPDVVQVQNLYPLLSPEILRPCAARNVPVVMRCPNYRLFCPSGTHLSHGRLCEKCLGGREVWCLLRNCEGDIAKSCGYALRNAWARLSRRITNNVHVFIVLSGFQKERFAQGGIDPDRLEVLPNIAPDLEPDPADGPGTLITFAGRVTPEKGIEDFVDAAARLPDLPFAVAGACDAMPILRDHASANIEWKGFLPGAELDALFRRTRILVIPSRWYEGFPNVAARAMALARPVLAARIGALPEIVADGETGLLFAPADPGDLAAKLRLLYQDPARCLRMGARGHARARREYSAEAVYQRLAAIYEKARVMADRSSVRHRHAV